MGLFGQLIALEVGIAGDGVVAGGLEVGRLGTALLADPLQLLAQLLVLAGGLAPFIDPVARQVALYRIQQLVMGTFGLGVGDARQDLLRITSYNVCYTKLLRTLAP